MFFYDDLKCIRHHYGLRHYITGTIHGTIGDTYNRMSILASDTEKIFSLWDCGQLIVVLSRTRIIKNTFFGSKEWNNLRIETSVESKKSVV